MARRVELDKLPSNNREKPEALTQITRQPVKMRRGDNLASNVRNIGNSLFEDIILPAVKSAIVDFFSNGVSMMMFGQDEGRVRRGRGNVAYHRMHDRRESPPMRRRQANFQQQDVLEDIYFESRSDAEATLGRMMERVAEYKWATIGDLRTLVGFPSNYTHERWGWTDLRGCRVLPTSDGYLIDFPEPTYFQ